MPAVTIMQSAEQEARLFESKVVPEPNTGCWLWTGKLDRDGYGHMPIRRDGRWTTTPAHRGMWQLRHGPMPADKLACHACDTPCCVNPDHVWPGTPQENTLDCIAKGRAVYRARVPDRLNIKKITVSAAEVIGRDPSVPEDQARRLLMRAYKRRDPEWREARVSMVLAERPAKFDPMAVTEVEKRATIAGYGMAVAILMRLRDEPVMATDLIIESGFTLAEFRGSGLEAYDLGPIERLFRSERRLRGKPFRPKGSPSPSSEQRLGLDGGVA